MPRRFIPASIRAAAMRHRFAIQPAAPVPRVTGPRVGPGFIATGPYASASVQSAVRDFVWRSCKPCVDVSFAATLTHVALSPPQPAQVGRRHGLMGPPQQEWCLFLPNGISRRRLHRRSSASSVNHLRAHRTSSVSAVCAFHSSPLAYVAKCRRSLPADAVSSSITCSPMAAAAQRAWRSVGRCSLRISKRHPSSCHRAAVALRLTAHWCIPCARRRAQSIPSRRHETTRRGSGKNSLSSQSSNVF